MKEGRVPLQTFRAEIDYGFSEANTTMGKIGIKVWIFKKEHFQKTAKELLLKIEEQQNNKRIFKELKQKEQEFENKMRQKPWQDFMYQKTFEPNKFSISLFSSNTFSNSSLFK